MALIVHGSGVGSALMCAALFAGAQSVSGAILTDTFLFRNGQSGIAFANGGIIPDANPSGWADVRVIDTVHELIARVEVFLGISGGFNGDLYGYVSGPNGGHAVLFNRVGRTASNSIGYSDPGIDIEFADSAGADVHLYRATIFALNSSGQLTGSWQPDGRAGNPFEITEGAGRTAMLSSFNGTNPNGEWTLFLADFSGGEESRVDYWGVAITTVPEPIETAVCVAGFLITGFLARKLASQRKTGLTLWRRRGGRSFRRE